jgi:F-type H+-transporting ATPase subunit gamma
LLPLDINGRFRVFVQWVKQVKLVYNRFVSVIQYEATFTEVYSLKALQASPAFAAYEIEADELATDMASFAMTNAIYHALVEGHAAEVSPSF